MNNGWRNWRYATFGSCGALSGAALAGNCAGACTACFGCVLMGGSLAILAVTRQIRLKKKENSDGVVATSH